MLVSNKHSTNVQNGSKNGQSWNNVKSQVNINNKQLQHRRIEFKPASNASNASSVSANGTNNSTNTRVGGEVTRKPVKDTGFGLFDPALVANGILWKKVARVGPGFFNDGNSCYLNSTLQCLMYTPSLTQVMRNESALVLKNLVRNEAQQQPKSIIQHFHSLVNEVWTSPAGKTISPRSMVSNIRRVGKQFKALRQEDAHEYLRQLLDCMHEEVLKANHVKVSDGKIAETTVISRVFGGYLCNTLTCSKCSYASKTYNHFQDVSLDITQGINSVAAAIDFFTKPEILSNGNEWKCEQCKVKVKAKKQMTFSSVPNVLVLHLKRFSYGNMNAKNTKQIEFGQFLTVNCSEGGVSKVRYELHGVVVHHGSSTHSGHYVAYVRAPNGQWHEMNDSRVTLVPLARVLQCQAYILFYSKVVAPAPAPAAAATPIDGAKSGVDPSVLAVPSVLKPQVNLSDVGEVVARPKVATPSASVKPIITAPSSSGSNVPAATPAAVDTLSSVPKVASTDSLLSKVEDVHENRLTCRLRRSVFMSPFRWVGPVDKIRRWSSRNKTNLREVGAALGKKRKLDQLVASEEVVESPAPLPTAAQKANPFLQAMSAGSLKTEDDEPAPYVRRNKNVVINELNTAGPVRNGGEVMRQLLSLSNRGRETGGEGIWDTVSEELAEEVRSLATKQRRDEQKEKNARRPDQWSAKLDEGRVKKVKLGALADEKNKSISGEDGERVNAFQAVQNNRGGDREAYFKAGSAPIEKKRKNHSSHDNNKEEARGGGGGGDRFKSNGHGGRGGGGRGDRNDRGGGRGGGRGDGRGRGGGGRGGDFKRPKH